MCVPPAADLQTMTASFARADGRYVASGANEPAAGRPFCWHPPSASRLKRLLEGEAGAAEWQRGGRSRVTPRRGPPLPSTLNPQQRSSLADAMSRHSVAHRTECQTLLPPLGALAGVRIRDKCPE